MFFYVKALHIIFVVTWFSGMFYLVRLFVYHRETQDKPESERDILQRQFKIMMKRLWFGITWPSCVLTLIFGTWVAILYGSFPGWLLVKLGFVGGLFLYHLSLQVVYRQQMENRFIYSSRQLRLWNEVASLFLFAIVFLVVLKTSASLFWGLGGLVVLALLITGGVGLYRKYRREG